MIILPEQKHDAALKALKRMCRDDDDIHGSGIDFPEEFLNAYLHGKNGDLKKAFKSLKNYVQVRKGKYSSFFRTVIPSRCKYFLELPKFEAFFRHRDTEGHVVGFFKLSVIDFSIIDVEDVFRSLVIAAEELLMSQEVATKGLVAVIDCRNIGIHHIKVFTPSRIQFLFNIFVGTFAIKYKGFHLLYDDSIIFHSLLKVFKAFAPKKIRERIFLHGSDEKSLQVHVPASILPEWIGGDLPVEECYDFEFENRAYAKEEHYKRLAAKW